jgi:hypothetical protein
MTIVTQKIELNFDGYFRNLPLDKLQSPGVYMVFCGSKSIIQSELMNLIYIGRSNDPKGRPDINYPKYDDWTKKLHNKDEVLYFSFAVTDLEVQAKAAMVFKLQPVCNGNGKKGFYHDRITIIPTGKTGQPLKPFTVWPTNN